jgi:RNA polymerase sigma-70 factor (ECF subfamily)
MFRAPNHLHEEKLLLEALKAGDQRAFDEIYRHYAPDLFMRAYHKTGVKEICEDIIQDIFAGLWMRRAEIEIRSLGAYLQGMLENKIIDYYRKACTHLKHIDQLVTLFERAEPSPIDKLAYKEQESALQVYIGGLSEKMRDIFMLSRYEQLSSEEISRRLNLSNQTVRNQISKALKILREKMTAPELPAPAAKK